MRDTHSARVSAAASYPYLAPTEGLDDDPTPRDQAIYVPSVTPSYAINVLKAGWDRPLAHGVNAADLNFLDPANRMFRISHVMSSAGQALHQTVPCIITQRDRQKTVLICDSGGYQIASGGLHIRGDEDRLRILRWMEQHGDLAMTLDVPTGPLHTRKPGYAYASFRECLDATRRNVSTTMRQTLA